MTPDPDVHSVTIVPVTRNRITSFSARCTCGVTTPPKSRRDAQADAIIHVGAMTEVLRSAHGQVFSPRRRHPGPSPVQERLDGRLFQGEGPAPGPAQ